MVLWQRYDQGSGNRPGARIAAVVRMRGIAGGLHTAGIVCRKPRITLHDHAERRKDATYRSTAL